MSAAATRVDTHADAELRAAWAELERGVEGPLRSLDPQRERATPLVELHTQVLRECPPPLRPVLERPLAHGLATLARAQFEAFPGNLFWDLDLIAATILAEAAALARPEAALACVEDRFARMARLQHLYGRATAINFSYVHDFVYGFDWAKWVTREPTLHAHVPGPFSLAFLVYMERRGPELLELIATNDHKYPSLPDERPRNPFPFSRAPAAEIELHRELARRDLIPVPTWDRRALALDWSARWCSDFQARRVELAATLELCAS